MRNISICAASVWLAAGGALAQSPVASPTPIPLVVPTPAATPKPRIKLTPIVLTQAQSQALLALLTGAPPTTPLPVFAAPPAGMRIVQATAFVTAGGQCVINLVAQ